MGDVAVIIKKMNEKMFFYKVKNIFSLKYETTLIAVIVILLST